MAKFHGKIRTPDTSVQKPIPFAILAQGELKEATFACQYPPMQRPREAHARQDGCLCFPIPSRPMAETTASQKQRPHLEKQPTKTSAMDLVQTIKIQSVQDTDTEEFRRIYDLYRRIFTLEEETESFDGLCASMASPWKRKPKASTAFAPAWH